MSHRISRGLFAVGLAFGMAVVAVATAGSASAVATTTVGLWNFNEAAGAHTAVDSSGNGQNGTVGSLVQTGANNRTAYRFSPNTATPVPPHLVTVANNARLNPDAGDYSVVVRLKTTRAQSNVVQKGQSGTAGGYWKLEIHLGKATCLFRGGDGVQKSIGSLSRVDNGAFHTIRCDRTATSVAVIVDGVRRAINGPSGTIANTAALAIGGKSSCNQTTIGCDFFTGDIDSVRILKG